MITIWEEFQRTLSQRTLSEDIISEDSRKNYKITILPLNVPLISKVIFFIYFSTLVLIRNIIILENKLE